MNLKMLFLGSDFIIKIFSRHSRFGGTFVVKSMKSISENELIYHKPLSKLDSFNFDVDKTKPKTPKNRVPVSLIKTHGLPEMISPTSRNSSY